jgi:hypothetical protein
MFDERMLGVQVSINERFESMEHIYTMGIKGGMKNLNSAKAPRRRLDLIFRDQISIADLK